MELPLLSPWARKVRRQRSGDPSTFDLCASALISYMCQQAPTVSCLDIILLNLMQQAIDNCVSLACNLA